MIQPLRLWLSRTKRAAAPARPRDLSVSRTPVHWIVATGVVLIAMILLGTIIMVDSFRDRALHSSKYELENTASLLTRHFEQQFDELHRIRKSVSAYLANNGVVTPASFSEQGFSHDTHLMLKAQRSEGTSGDLALIDATGRLVNWSESWPVPEIDLSNADYFKKLKAGSIVEEEVVEAIHSRTKGRLTTLFARKLVGPNGEFLGVVTRCIEPLEFERFFASVQMSRNFTMAMFHSDGKMLARFPQAPAAFMGMQKQGGSLVKHMQSSKAPATMVTVSPVDGVERLGTVRSLRNFPLAVIVTDSVSNVLKDWREQTRFLIVVATLSAVIIAALLYLIMREVTEQHRASQIQLTREKQRLDTAINNMSQGLLLFDGQGHMVVCNQGYMKMYGLSPDVVKPGCHFRDVIAHRRDTGSFIGDVNAYCDIVMNRSLHNSPGERCSTIMQTADGRFIHVLDGTLSDGGWIATHEDITERRRADERIAHLAQYDSLTDLPNRTLFHERLEQEIALLAGGQKCAIIYIDIDEFKGINDSLGHTVGDELLKAVASRLRTCVRERDVVARLGGDEFAIVLTDVQQRSDVNNLINRIYEAIREPTECQGHRLITDASIGIALAPDHGNNLDQLLKNADLAMYSAKADGRRTYRFFEPEMDARVKARRALELDLREATEHGNFARAGFEIYYQPLLSLSSNAITGCEALLRWRHPDRGMVSPADFIPVAEEIGVISKLGEWVLTHACREAARWPNQIKIAVNVSPVQFRTQSLALKVIQALSGSGLPAHRLELEITEAVLIRDDEMALAILHRLRDIGVRIALDDFGTGYSSLSYLQRFPFDKIKIDRCFISDITEAGGSSAIVEAVVNIASSRKMTTTAEGVETAEQREMLRRLGCTELQGYLFSPARPASDVFDLIAAHIEAEAGAEAAAAG